MAGEAKPMTAAEAAKLVTRTVGDKKVPVKVDEVLSFKDHGTRVVVVTRDGQKLVGAA